MQLTTWRPFQDTDDVFGRYMRLFNSRLPELLDKDGNHVAEWSPSADISETKKEYLIKTDLPDVEKSDIQVSVNDGMLTIDGERKNRKEEEDETYHRVESFYGKFSRTFTLPDNVDEAKIGADCKNGVLRVHLPKTKESPRRSVEVKVS
jgi:HSP20 family protein